MVLTLQHGWLMTEDTKFHSSIKHFEPATNPDQRYQLRKRKARQRQEASLFGG
jgi:hypothetical protein